VAEIADTFNAGITEITEGLFIFDRAIWFATFVRRVDRAVRAHPASAISAISALKTWRSRRDAP